MHMRHIVIRGLPRSALFFRLSHKRHDFRKMKKKTTEHKILVLIVLIFLQLLSEISHSEKN